jgi:hypothetical protein
MAALLALAIRWPSSSHSRWPSYSPIMVVLIILLKMTSMITYLYGSHRLIQQNSHHAYIIRLPSSFCSWWPSCSPCFMMVIMFSDKIVVLLAAISKWWRHRISQCGGTVLRCAKETSSSLTMADLLAAVSRSPSSSHFSRPNCTPLFQGDRHLLSQDGGTACRCCKRVVIFLLKMAVCCPLFQDDLPLLSQDDGPA